MATGREGGGESGMLWGGCSTLPAGVVDRNGGGGGSGTAGLQPAH